VAKKIENGSYLFTSESVSMGHPDKVSDQISDAVLDSLLKHDPQARCACETLCTTGLVVIAGEVTVHNQKAEKALLECEETARQVIRDIGYDEDGMMFSADSCAVVRTIHGQSADIAMGVDREGAGDQGMMFGFACRETPQLMPLPIMLSHKLMDQHVKVRRSKKIKALRPDAKSQVTVRYEGLKPVAVDTVVLSTQHGPEWNGKAKQAQLKKQIIQHVIKPALGKWFNNKITFHVNPTGQFEIGGPHGDAGLTGRKIIVDTYGGRGRQGPDQGRPLGRLHVALHRQEHRRGEVGRRLRNPVELRNRGGPAHQRPCRLLWHGEDPHPEDQQAGAPALQADAAWYHRYTEVAQADLP